MVHKINMCMAGVLVYLGFCLTLIGLHDFGMPEDSRIVWICSLHGDGGCGPGAPFIQVDPSQSLNWHRSPR